MEEIGFSPVLTGEDSDGKSELSGVKTG